MTEKQKNIKARYEGMQNALTECGLNGCFFLALVSIAEESTQKKIDLLDAIAKAKQADLIKDDFFVNDSAGVLSLLTGKQWRRIIVKPNELKEPIAENVYTVEKWVSGTTGYTHFRRRYVDTVKNSQTVRNGKLACYYTFTDLSKEA